MREDHGKSKRLPAPLWSAKTTAISPHQVNGGCCAKALKPGSRCKTEPPLTPIRRGSLISPCLQFVHQIGDDSAYQPCG